MTEFFVFMPLQGITLRSSWLEGNFSMDYKITWKIKVMQMKTKQYLETLIVLWIKCMGMVKIERKYFKDVVSIMPCQNLSWIMG